MIDMAGRKADGRKLPFWGQLILMAVLVGQTCMGCGSESDLVASPDVTTRNEDALESGGVSAATSVSTVDQVSSTDLAGPDSGARLLGSFLGHAEVRFQSDRVVKMGVSEDGRIVSIGSRGEALIWNPEMPSEIDYEFFGHSGDRRPVADIARLGDGDWVTVGSSLQIWSPNGPSTSDQQIFGTAGEASGAVERTANDKLVAGANSAILTWDRAAPPSAELQSAVRQIGTGMLFDLLLLSSGDLLVSISSDKCDDGLVRIDIDESSNDRGLILLDEASFLAENCGSDLSLDSLVEGDDGSVFGTDAGGELYEIDPVSLQVSPLHYQVRILAVQEDSFLVSWRGESSENIGFVSSEQLRSGIHRGIMSFKTIRPIVSAVLLSNRRIAVAVGNEISLVQF